MLQEAQDYRITPFSLDPIDVHEYRTTRYSLHPTDVQEYRITVACTEASILETKQKFNQFVSNLGMSCIDSHAFLTRTLYIY